MIINFTKPLRPLLFQVHRWVGLVLGLWLAVAGLSGSALVFGEALERRLSPELFRVVPGGPRAPLSQVLQGLAEVAGPTPPRLLRVPEAADAPYEAWLDATGQRRAWVDPYSARVLGVRTAQQTATGWLHALHVNLFSGETGKTLVGLGGLALLLLGLTGLVLWWPGRRKLALGFTVRRPLTWRRGNFDVHKVAGILALPLLLLAALSGTLLVFHAAFDPLLPRPTSTTPAAPTPAPTAPGVDALLALADRALPGARTTRVDFPQKPGAPLRVRKRFPEEVHPNGMSVVVLEPQSGAVLQVQSARGAPLAWRLWTLRYPLHIGSWGGLPTRLLAALVGLTPAALFLTGLFVWLDRLRRRVPVASARLSPQTPPRA